MVVVFFIITILYGISTFNILNNVLNYNLKFHRLLKCFLLIPFSVAPAFFVPEKSVILLLPIILIFQTTIFKIYTKTKYSTILYIYCLLYAINACLSAFISIIFNVNNMIMTDLIANVIFFAICTICCFSKVHVKLASIVSMTPAYIKLSILCVLFFEMLLFSLIADKDFFTHDDTWFSYLQRDIITLFIVIVAVLIIFVALSVSNSKLRELTKNYEEQIQIQAEHYKRLSEGNRDLRLFRHDFKNMSIAIEKLITDGKTTDAINLLKDSAKSMDLQYSGHGSFKTGNPIADALLVDKQQKAQLIGAKIIFDGFIPADHLSPTDVCVLLGNTIDNAVEACEKFPPETIKSIYVTAGCTGSIAFIQIENPITKKVCVRNNQIKTTKTNKTLHGFGLYSLNSIIKKYSGSLKISSTESKFTIDISLCLNTINN